MGYTSDRTRVALALLLLVVVTTACAGSNVARTRAPITTSPPTLAGAPGLPVASVTPVSSPAPVVASAAPVATQPAASTAPASSLPGPTPIIDEGLPAPALDGLVTSEGPFDLASLQGQPTLVFFGYTHCPDVCPATIGELVELVGRRPDIHVVFVTVDPERDTPKFMGEWTEFLPDSFVGVTGSPTAIKTAADGYGVRYARVDSASANGYSMSHTAFVYLIDADGQLRLHFPFGTGWESMLKTLDTIAPADQEVPS